MTSEWYETGNLFFRDQQGSAMDEGQQQRLCSALTQLKRSSPCGGKNCPFNGVCDENWSLFCGVQINVFGSHIISSNGRNRFARTSSRTRGALVVSGSDRMIGLFPVLIVHNTSGQYIRHIRYLIRNVNKWIYRSNWSREAPLLKIFTKHRCSCITLPFFFASMFAYICLADLANRIVDCGYEICWTRFIRRSIFCH